MDGPIRRRLRCDPRGLAQPRLVPPGQLLSFLIRFLSSLILGQVFTISDLFHSLNKSLISKNNLFYCLPDLKLGRLHLWPGRQVTSNNMGNIKYQAGRQVTSNNIATYWYTDIGNIKYQAGRQELHWCWRVRRTLSCRSHPTVREKLDISSFIQPN